MKRILLVLALLLLAALIAGGGYFYYVCRIAEPAWVTGPATRGEIRKIVSAAGALETLNSVEVGSQISGIISSLTVDFNDEVQAGQLLAVIDPTAYEAQLNQALANREQAVSAEQSLHARLVSQQASCAGGEAELQVQKAFLKKAEIARETARRHLTRVAGMFRKNMVPESDLDDAKSSVEAAEAGVDAAQAEIRVVESRRVSAEAQRKGVVAELEGAAATIRQMEAQIALARANLEKTRVLSPIAGVVISRNVSMGQTVSAANQTPVLFTIAQDLRRMQIEALIDESDVCRVQPGQPATFTVDPFPERTFAAKVVQVRISPKTEGKIMYPVILEVENPDRLLKPGLTAKIGILVEHQRDVLRIPTEALFFTPPKDILQRFSPAGTGKEQASETMKIWVVNSSGRLEPLEIRAGISNAEFTEVLSDNLASGTTVVKFLHEWWMGWFQR